MKLLTAFSVLASSLGAAFAQETATTGLRGAVLDRDLQSFSVTSLQLLEASTSNVIATLTMGATITVPSGTGLNIKAEGSGPVGSVLFGYGTNANFKVETSPPYAFCGNIGVVYSPCSVLTAGTHTVTATPYSAGGATGTQGTPYTITFSIVFGGSVPLPAPVPAPVTVPTASPPFSVTSLQLIETSTSRVISTLTMGATITVPSGTGLNIKAEGSGPVGSVLFGYGSNANFKVETSPPYAFCGNVGVLYSPCSVLTAGTHTVSATPYSAGGATGTKGTPFTITFSIVFEGPVPVPVAVPVPAPVTAPSPLPPTPSGTSPTHSAWLLPVETPVIAVAAAHLPDGRILMWSSKSRTSFGTDPSTVTWTAIYNPTTGGMTEELVSSTNHDMFCPGTTVLPNGVVMISGGANSKATSFYDYRNNQWSVGPQMKLPRGYQAHTLLETGEVFSFGGSWSGAGGDKDGEVWSPQTNSWRLLTGVPSKPANTGDKGGRYRSDNHYWLFLAPNGKVFHAGPSKQMHWITTPGNGSLQASILRGDDTDAMNGNAIMYDIGKILTVGGAQNYDDGAASKRAYIIDINGSEATVKRIQDMQFARALGNSVVLPNGEVVVIGGMSTVKLFSDANAILEAEIWSPSTETFKTLKPMRVPRTYHSVALILKDGRVWAAGGGLCGCGANHKDFEILTPPYLYNADGTLATRPSIQAFPATAKAGDVITVEVNTNENHTFALVKASAVTHSVNNDQRRFPLQLVSNSGSIFTLKITDNKNVALPGFYFLFAMNSNGVPSVGETIRIDL